MARILIADDNKTIRDLMRFYLEHSGHIVCGEAHDGIQAIECAKQLEPDLILLDLTMPGMNGIETTSLLKRILPNTPIILFTLHEDSINREFAATMGVDLVVDKMGGIPKLGQSIKELLARVKAPSTGNGSEPASDKDVADLPQKPD
jgi:CheY-like chemotaxis protein